MRYVVALALGLTVALTSASAAELEPDALAVSRAGGLYAVDESGAIAGTIVADPPPFEISAVAWSPDGTRFAFVDSLSRRALLVGSVTGGVREVAQLPAGDEWTRHVGWVSPAEVVLYRRAAGQATYSLWLVSADDGRSRLLAEAVEPNAAPLPQPRGSLLAYVSSTFSRTVIDVRTGQRFLLPADVSAVAWAPDGRLLAAATRDGIDVMRPDGGERRTVASFPLITAGASPVRSLEWAPDGTRLAFVLSREFPELTSRFGTPVRNEIHTIALEGGPPQQLTGVVGDDLYAGGSLGSIDPSWWPNGSRLFFKRAGQDGILTMNADGSCEAPWRGPDSDLYPVWRPGATVSSKRVECSSIILRAQRRAGEVSYRDSLRVRVVLFNDGTRALRNVRVVLQTSLGTLDVPGRDCGGGSRVVCAIGELPAGRGTVVAADVAFRVTGGARITASASHTGDDVDPADDTAAVTVDVSPCDLLGTWSSDRLVGSRRGELICGRPGGDFIEARGGNDRILAGSGGDTILAGPGRDRVYAGGGSDRINARDRQRDVVDCGSERDSVVADRIDVLRSCEQVRRR